MILKTYSAPTNLFVLGANITKKKEDEELCVFITDDYCSGLVAVNNDNAIHIETEGSLLVVTKEQLDKAISEFEDIESSEEMGVVELSNFIGDIYVQLLDEDGKDCLKENPDLSEHLVYEYREDLENEWRDVQLSFIGSCDSYTQKELKDLL